MSAPAQLRLDDAEPEPIQPMLLPEPPFWESGTPEPARWAGFCTATVHFPAHLRSKTSPEGAQLHLFP